MRGIFKAEPARSLLDDNSVLVEKFGPRMRLGNLAAVLLLQEAETNPQG